MNRLLTTLMLMLSCFIARGAEKADYAQVRSVPIAVFYRYYLHRR